MEPVTDRPTPTAPPPSEPRHITSDNAEARGTFSEYRKTATTRISDFTVPPGVPYRTPEGLRAEDEDTRIAFDVQGGVYPIRESVFRVSYAPARATDSSVTPPAAPIDVLRGLIRERIPHFIPENPQPWFNLGSLGGVKPDGDKHALFLHEDGFRKVEPIRLTADDLWMLGEAFLVYAEYARLTDRRPTDGE